MELSADDIRVQAARDSWSTAACFHGGRKKWDKDTVYAMYALVAWEHFMALRCFKNFDTFNKRIILNFSAS